MGTNIVVVCILAMSTMLLAGCGSAANGESPPASDLTTAKVVPYGDQFWDSLVEVLKLQSDNHPADGTVNVFDTRESKFGSIDGRLYIFGFSGFDHLDGETAEEFNARVYPKTTYSIRVNTDLIGKRWDQVPNDVPVYSVIDKGIEKLGITVDGEPFFYSHEGAMSRSHFEFLNE